MTNTTDPAERPDENRQRHRESDAGDRESRERVQRGGEPDTDALGNADGSS